MVHPVDMETNAASLHGGPRRAESVTASLHGLLLALLSLIGDRVDLLSLEITRASRALAKIVALVVVTAILGVTAWLAAWVGIGAALMQLGLAWPYALIAVVAANLLTCWWALLRMRRLAPLLGLPATRRHLSFGRGPSAPAAEGAT